MSEEFVGAGWAFPLRTDPTGRMALVRHDREIEESIRVILSTAYGERPMRPEFGCAIHDYVFAPVDASTAGAIAYEVELSLERWEPRINVHEVDISIDQEDASTIYILIRYVIRGTYDPRNLVFPFYVIPSESSEAPEPSS